MIRQRPSLLLSLLLLAALVSSPSLSAQTGDGSDPGELLERAERHAAAFELDSGLEAYDRALAVDDGPRTARSYARWLLAMALWDRAEAVLDSGLERSPGDAVLLEHRAVLAAGRGDVTAAASWVQRSWDAGADRHAWLERGRLFELRAEPELRPLVDRRALVESLGGATLERRRDLLRLLGDVGAPGRGMSERKRREIASALESLLSVEEDSEVLRLGLRALDALDRGSETAPGHRAVLDLLEAASPQARRAALLEVRENESPTRQQLRAVTEAAAAERDPGNADLARVVETTLQARLEPARAEALLGTIPESNLYRQLALYELASHLRATGETARAAAVETEAALVRPSVESAAESTTETRGGDDARSVYWQCTERLDLEEIRELLRHHDAVERLDARVWGLPRNDFDDQKALSLAERVFLRSWAREQGLSWPTSGEIQYPREIGHLLRRMQREAGARVDCSGLLVELGEEPARTIAEDGSELKLEEDTDKDNEVNIAVNPYDPRYVVATSNPPGGGGNIVYRSSDWGESWTVGSADVANNCCDPVSYYNRTEVSGEMTDVLYHSTLVFSSGNPISRMLYSTDHGASWNDCGTNIGSSARDRQDHAIDTNPTSACYNTIYLAHHNGTQYVATSTGATFPYCQSWNEQSAGVSGTIGSAIVVSTNGTAHNIFTQYGSPGGLYLTSTTDCGSGWTSATKIADISNPGDFEWPIPSTSGRQVYRYPQADSDRQASSVFRNNIYVVWNDLETSCTPPGASGNTTCNNDIFFLLGEPDDRDDPTSWSWTKSNLTHTLSDDYTDEFYPSLTVDQADGSIYVSYYRTNSGSASLTPRQTQVHYVMLRSIDGGATWEGPLQITDLPTDESGNGANLAMQWGDYTWNDVIDGVAYASWTDRREALDEDVWAAKVCSEPSHWSERAPSFTTPSTVATPDGGGLYTFSWTLPDLYWGDGGESPSSRKFQLVMDSSVVVDNIDAASTSQQYQVPAGSHDVLVRAVNQCGVAKDYDSVNVTGEGEVNNQPTVTITQPATDTTVTEGDPLTLQGTANDTEDGDLTASIAWSSDLDGSLGTGGSVSPSLSVGEHLITASVTDSGSLSQSATRTITVETAPTGNDWSEDFEGDVSGWTTSGLWHRVDDSGCASPAYSSATHAFYYGEDGDCHYDTGAQTLGQLLSPTIEGITENSELSFDHLRTVESSVSSSYDFTRVQVREAGGASWVTVWERSSLDPSSVSWGPSGAISLSAWDGQDVEIRFYFDTTDDQFNDYLGWFVDDVSVTNLSSPVVSPIFDDGFESGDTTAWSTQVN